MSHWLVSAVPDPNAAFAVSVGCPVHALSAYDTRRGWSSPMGRSPPAATKPRPNSPSPRRWRRGSTGAAGCSPATPCSASASSAAGGAYRLVQENQPTLHDAIRLRFDPPPDLAALPLLDHREAQTVERGHGRTDERRRLVASTDLTAYLDLPGVVQVFRLERTWRDRGKAHRALHYGIASLTPAQADPTRLLALRRGHWAIENALHRQQDVAFGEDACLVHFG